jgi:choice-of-anchor A domain-containing protein
MKRIVILPLRIVFRALLVVCLGLLWVAPASASYITLGDAAAFAVFGLGSSTHDAKVKIEDEKDGAFTTVNGDVAVGPVLPPNGKKSEWEFKDGPKAIVNGDVYLGIGATVKTNEGTLNGSLLNQDLGQPLQDALDASSTAASKTPDRTFTEIKQDLTITSINPGGETVIEITGNLELDKETLTLSGGSSDKFIINVLGKFKLQNTALIEGVGGVGPEDVLFNIVATGDDVFTHEDSDMIGTLLAVDRKFDAIRGEIAGSIIGARDTELIIKYGAQVNYQPYAPVPIPGAVWLLASGLIGVVGVRRKFRG